MRHFQQYIDGQFEDARRHVPQHRPRYRRALGDDARGAIRRCRPGGRSRPPRPSQRSVAGDDRDGARQAADATRRPDRDNAQALAEVETRDTGKIIRETSAQIAYVADYYAYYGGLADKIEGAHLPIDKPDMEVWIRREPVGVVAAIVPWNSQLFLAAVKLGPALAAGCTVVLKASEDGPAPLLEFARLVHEAGFPPGVVNIITGFGDDCGAALTRHPKVAHVAFTGGPATARHIVRNSAENLASTSLELGGKSPFVVFADADLDSAANAQVAGIFAAAGPELRRRFAAHRRGIRQATVPGDPESEGRSGTDRTTGRPGDRGRPAVHGSPAPPDRVRRRGVDRRRRRPRHRWSSRGSPGLLLPTDDSRLRRRRGLGHHDRTVRTGALRGARSTPRSRPSRSPTALRSVSPPASSPRTSPVLIA